MKKVITFAFLTLLTCSLWAQALKPLSPARKQEMINKICQVSGAMKTLQCDFTQVKQLPMLNDKMVSKGKMYYKQSSLLRWEYISPYKYIFIMNGTNVYIKSAKKKSVIDTRSNKLFPILF